MVAQIIAISIFIVMFLLIILDKIERQYVTLGCGAAVLIVVFGICQHDFGAIARTLNLKSFFTLDFWYVSGSSETVSTGINWATILFIAGMMIMVEGMAKSGFFRWLCLTIVKLVHYKIIPIFLMLMIMSACLAMFIDSITVILFLAAMTVELGQILKFNPVPMILSEIFCANLGGSATMCGDPPNIIIGTSLGFSFFDFVENTGLMALISLVFIILYFFLAFRKELETEAHSQQKLEHYPEAKEAITNYKEFYFSCLIFGCAVLLLVTHAMTGLTVAFIGTAIAVATLLAAGKDAGRLLKLVDYKTLLFFVGLFIVVSGLEETGVLEIISSFIVKLSGGNGFLMVIIILWLSAIASAFVDNIPFAATMIPVIRSLSIAGHADLAVLAWALSMGTDIGGCATPIGASANVVGISVATKAGHPIGWGKYCKTAIPATVIVLVISMITIWVRYY